MSNQLVQSQVRNITNFFVDQVTKFVTDLPETVGISEARRLTVNLCIEANAKLEEQDMAWKNVDANKFLMDCIRMVTLGLDAGNDECYPIPYKNSKTKKIELQCSPSARGLEKLVMEYSVGKKIVRFDAYAIKEDEVFSVKRTPGNDLWSYEEQPFSSGKVAGYVTIAVYEDGTSSVMTHSKEDIEKRRQASKAPNSPAWKIWYTEMALAKATRRHCKRIPIKLPDAKEQAFKRVDEDEDDFETFKDVTPPTIMLSEEIEEEEFKEEEPVPEPEPAPVVVKKQKSKARQTTITPDPVPPPPEPPEEEEYSQIPIDWMEV